MCRGKSWCSSSAAHFMGSDLKWSEALTGVTVTHLYELHHGDGVEEVKAPEAVQPAGGAGDVGDGQRGRVAGEDRVPAAGRHRNVIFLKTPKNKP